MLYAFFGSDNDKVRARANEFVHARVLKGAEVVRISPENYAPQSIESAAGSSSLFGLPQVVVVDTPSGNTEMFENVFEILEVLKDSENAVVLIEGKLLAPEKKKLAKQGAICEEYIKESVPSFNSFSLADALLARDKKQLWVLLMKAKAEGLSAEELIGTLFWQLKALRLATRAGSADEAGLKPFVYGKAKSALPKFKEGELDHLSESLMTLYHDGHQGVRDIDIALERWVLVL